MVLPTVAHISKDVRHGTRSWSCPVRIVEGPSSERLRVMAGADAAIAVSGTVALELASLGIPHVIAYRANPLTGRHSSPPCHRPVCLSGEHHGGQGRDSRVHPGRVPRRCHSRRTFGTSSTIPGKPKPRNCTWPRSCRHFPSSRWAAILRRRPRHPGTHLKTRTGRQFVKPIATVSADHTASKTHSEGTSALHASPERDPQVAMRSNVLDVM